MHLVVVVLFLFLFVAVRGECSAWELIMMAATMKKKSYTDNSEVHKHIEMRSRRRVRHLAPGSISGIRVGLLVRVLLLSVIVCLSLRIPLIDLFSDSGGEAKGFSDDLRGNVAPTGAQNIKIGALIADTGALHVIQPLLEEIVLSGCASCDVLLLGASSRHHAKGQVRVSWRTLEISALAGSEAFVSVDESRPSCQVFLKSLYCNLICRVTRLRLQCQILFLSKGT